MADTIIFETLADRMKFDLEEDLSTPVDDRSNKISVDELLISSRLKKRKVLKDYRRSMLAKKQWVVNKHKLMRGITKFHNSTKGKQFHRALGRRIATRDFKSRSSLLESLIALNSLKVHLLIGCKYFSSIDEEVDYELFVDEACSYIGDIETRFNKVLFELNEEQLVLSEDEYDFLSDVIYITEEDYVSNSD